MSFLEHLDELRRRLIRIFLFLTVSFLVCWFFSDRIYNFLSIPIRRAISEAERKEIPIEGLSGEEKLVSITEASEGQAGRYVFSSPAQIGGAVIEAGASVAARVAKDKEGRIGLFTTEPLFTDNAVIPAGVRLPVEIEPGAEPPPPNEEKMIVTTAFEPFSLYVTVSLYTAIAVSIPFLLFQIWGFVSPALYEHERAYVTPFILLSSISFVVGAGFAYYVLFPPAARYLLGLGSDFRILLKASDYLDFILLIMLAMGIIFQMPAVAYVLARIGLISAGMMIRFWKPAIIIILVVAAVASPTSDIPNMLLFAAPMVALYVVSIFIAWFFGRKRTKEPQAEG
ncbi:MAG TPA: twin-arginine translocase subunit TatC [Pyrinomonadaceae bacterium]|nr:twin-arginine translocase subunit TatC [Pyrinomonadaceae bacterium]